MVLMLGKPYFQQNLYYFSSSFIAKTSSKSIYTGIAKKLLGVAYV